MTNEDILTLIYFISNKKQSGKTLSPSDFNIILPAAVLEFAKEQRGLYELTQEVTNAIKHLKIKDYNLSVNSSSGQATLPTNYDYGGQLYYSDSSSNYRKIDIVTDSEFNLRMASPLRVPTTKEPIAKFVGDYLYFYPKSLGANVKFSYLKQSVTPNLDYYIDSDDQPQFFSVGDSDYTLQTGEEGSNGESAGDVVTPATVEMDWRDEDKLIIADKILTKIGINLEKPEIIQYVELQKKERVMA